jgi:hypothetical protein
MSTIQCSLHTTFAAKWSTQRPVCAMSTVASVKSSVNDVLQILS